MAERLTLNQIDGLTLNHLLKYMAEKGVSVTMYYDETERHWGCAWVYAGERYIGSDKDDPKRAVSKCLERAING